MDLQILKDLQQFLIQQKTPATVVLISGDSDFIREINELRYQGGHYTIIIHTQQAKSELLRTANETIEWEEFVETNSTEKILKYQTYGSRESKGKSAKSSSPKCEPAKSRSCDSPTNPSLLPQKLMQLKFDHSAINASNNVLKSTSPIRHEELDLKKKNRKSKSKYVLNKYIIN